MSARPLVAAALAFVALPAVAAPFTAIANPAAFNGSERCATATTCVNAGRYGGLSSVVQLFARSQGATLLRVDDITDQLWTALPGAAVFGLGRAAQNDFSLGRWKSH